MPVAAPRRADEVARQPRSECRPIATCAASLNSTGMPDGSRPSPESRIATAHNPNTHGFASPTRRKAGAANTPAASNPGEGPAKTKTKRHQRSRPRGPRHRHAAAPCQRRSRQHEADHPGQRNMRQMRHEKADSGGGAQTDRERVGWWKRRYHRAMRPSLRSLAPSNTPDLIHPLETRSMEDGAGSTMAADLSLPSITAAGPAERRTAPSVRPVHAIAPEPTAVSPIVPNPRLRLDATLGLVVLEFRGAVGSLDRSIPSPQELAAYRAAALTGAPLPPGLAPLTTRQP